METPTVTVTPMERIQTVMTVGDVTVTVTVMTAKSIGFVPGCIHKGM